MNTVNLSDSYRRPVKSLGKQMPTLEKLYVVNCSSRMSCNFLTILVN